MSNSRKVQADIDRLLKKTNEGIEAYEELFNKFANAPNPNAKERLEGDLKKEIKKLQRHREQIKSLIASAEVKDTKALESYRKRIEDKMEAFKTCEREMKTKAFSKEGLASAANELYESPLAQMETWLKGAIEEARKKIELLEYDVVRMNNTMRATRKNKQQQQQQKSDVVVQLEKMQIHFHKWEALLRMVTNEEITRDEFDELQPAIEKVLQDDVDMAVLSDMSIYADYDIPDPKLKLPVNDDDVAVSVTANSNSNSSNATAAEERRGAQGGNNSSSSSSSKNASTSNTAAATSSSVAAVKKTPPPLPAAGVARGSNHVTPGTLDNNSRNSKPSTRATPDDDAATSGKSQHHTTAAAATATAASTPSSTTAAVQPSSSSSPPQQQPRRSSGNSAAVPVIEDDNDTAPEWLDDEMDNVNDDTFGDAATAAVLGAAGGAGAGAAAAAGAAAGFSLADMANNTSKALGEWERQRTQSRGGNNGSNATSPSSQPAAPPSQQQRPTSSSGDGGSGNNSNSSSSNNGSRAAATTTNEWERRKLELLKGKSPSAASGGGAAAGGGGEASAGAAAAAATTASTATASSSSSPSAQPQQQREGNTSAASSSPVPSQHAQQQAAQAHAGSVAAALPRDRAHTARYDMATTLSLLDMSLANLPHTLDVERQRPYEPPNAIEPIAYFPQEVHPVLSNREIYHNFDLDTLFFIFYYHQKSYQQYFAAKELKAHSFRYHAEQRRWYLRREKPRETSATSERGSYTYFDFEDTWETQTTDDFVFEYKYLEDDLV